MISMHELFYSESVPVYMVHHGWQPSSTCWGFKKCAYQPDVTQLHCGRQGEFVAVDLVVPMCCTRCEDQVRDALYALRGVEDVVCDLHNQRVTVAGYLETALVLQQLRRVKNGATFCSQSSHGRQHRPEVFLYQRSHNIRQVHRDCKTYVQLDTNEQRSYSENRYNHSSSKSYSRSFCPTPRDTTRTHYASVPNPVSPARIESEC